MCPWRGGGLSCSDGFGFVFQLGGGAVGVEDVVAFSEIDGLVDAAAFPVGVEVADFDHRDDPGDGVVRPD